MTRQADSDRETVLARRAVSRETLARLDAFEKLLRRWQATTNLVAPSTLGELWSRHLEEGLILCEHLPHMASRIVDLGSGGGLPGIVVGIVLKERGAGAAALVESNGKKAAFLRTVARELDLPVEVHAARIEVSGPVIAEAEIVTARALAPLDRLFEMVGSQLDEDATCLFPKGENHEGEIEAATARWHFDMVKHLLPERSGSVILEIRRLRKRR